MSLKNKYKVNCEQWKMCGTTEDEGEEWARRNHVFLEGCSGPMTLTSSVSLADEKKDCTVLGNTHLHHHLSYSRISWLNSTCFSLPSNLPCPRVQWFERFGGGEQRSEIYLPVLSTTSHYSNDEGCSKKQYKDAFTDLSVKQGKVRQKNNRNRNE